VALFFKFQNLPLYPGFLVYFVWSESALVSDFIQSKLLQYFSSSALQDVSRTHLGSLYMLFELSCNSLCHESSRLATTILAPHCSDRAPEAFKSVSNKPICFCTHSRFFPVYWTCPFQFRMQSSLHQTKNEFGQKRTQFI
jgi:hypothetical protein